jgi:hypothetical protein
VFIGKSCEYSEPCASILASTPVGGPRGKFGSSVVNIFIARYKYNIKIY